jgi:hypothetical protein
VDEGGIAQEHFKAPNAKRLPTKEIAGRDKVCE